MSMVSASPGITRMRPKTISDERSRTGTASISRRATYLCMPPSSTRPPLLSPSLLVDPGPGERRRAVAVGATQRRRRRVAHVRLEDQEPAVVRHPQAQHLIVLAIHDFLGQRPL